MLNGNANLSEIFLEYGLIYKANCASTKSFHRGRLRTIVHAIIKVASTAKVM